ncbi:C1 family peptidase [Sneathia vaginalis]|uniref:aminopeptidase C n=1 Tax=Sneathia vaginalis TaxID=187101 RepID=UPI002599A207|nr:C1 family peptidase [Sneathia vaginalis]
MINKELLEKFEGKYLGNEANLVIQDAITNVGINEASLRKEVVKKHEFVFSDETKKGEITNQKRSGRCWMFSALNVLRVNTMEKLNVETFEFSQAYLQFFDKIEKANTYLEYIIETKDLPVRDRLVEHIMSIGVSDGGYWSFFVGLATKYGVVPKSVMPETFHSSNTDILNEVLDVRLKRAACLIRKAKTSEEISKIKDETLYQVYNICVKALGMPPKKFTYEYRDKDKKFVRIKDVTPKEFMELYAKDDLLSKVELVADPREEHMKGRMYELPYSCSVIEYGPSKFLNVTIDELKKVTIASIKDGAPVWFGCDVGQSSDRKLGILDSELYNYDKTLTQLGEFSKVDRLLNYSAYMTHAMTFVGVDLDDEGKPLMWEVENSWGDEVGKKGIFSMSDKWFDDHNYSVVVDKKYISDEFKDGLDKEVIKLDYFDPLG